MLKPEYFLRLGKESLNISDLVDTRETLITRQLCTTKFKSAIDTASITIKYSTDRASLRTQILDILYFSLETLEDVELNIRLDNYSLFKGYLDLTELKLVSKRLPEVLKLEAQDISAKILDRKVNDYIFFENKTVSEIVKSLISRAGGTFFNNAMLPKDDRIIPVFTVDREDDDDTYRNYIDKLLFEAGGYVLDTNEYGTMSIVALPWENYNPTKTVDDFQLDKGIETSKKLFDKDGLKLVWSTLSETGKNQRVWTAEFSRQIKDGKVTGITIPAGGYYPENGDIEATYQPFSVDFLDREYITKQTREKNKDLSIIAVRDVSAQMVTLGSDGKPFPNEYTWEFPVLPSLGMVTNPTIYAKKAWYLLRNKQRVPMNLQMFTLEGRVLYRSKINYLTIPATAEKLDEYKSEYIFTEEHAKRFAQFYWHFLKYTSTIHKWSVLGDVALGDVVKILHKGASAAQATMIVSETLHFVGNTSKIDCVGVALGAYNEYPVKSWTDSESITPPVQIPEAPKSLTIDVYPSNVSYYADNFPVDDATKIKVTVRGENTTETINVAWVGGKATLPKEGGIIEIPVKDLTAVDVLPVSATTSGITASATVSKSFKSGKLNLFANKHMFGFYADNVAHDLNETVHIDYMATGFKNEPTIYIDGVPVTMDANKAYDIPVSAVQDKDSLKIEAKIAGFYDSMIIQKVMDVPSLNLVLSGTQFFYSADNVAHDLAAKIHVAVKTSGIYQKPVLKIDGVVEPLDAEQSCVIPTSKCDNELNLHLEATCFTLIRTADINKVMDIPSVSLSLSTDHFTYYADNVVREGQPDIVASTNSMGIARGLKLTVNDIEFPLNDAGQAFIPSTVLNGNVEVADVKVEPRYIVTISDVRKISKEYMTPSLTLLTDAAQFAFDINGMPSPEVANIEWRTEGLSSAVVPSLKVQNQPRQWVGKKVIISYLEILSANFLRVIAEVERFNLKREIVINKVNDSKAILPIVEYAYGASATEPPMVAWISYEDHALKYGELQLIYEDGWQPMRPELVPADKPYLWMRISVDGGKTFTYSPLTGPKGEDGKQSMYCGMNTARPISRPDGSPLVKGDYYLNIADRSQPVPYILDENGVWRLVTTTDPNWSAIASVTREDVLGLGVALNTSSAYYGFFAMLSANEAYLDNLGAQNIVMKNGGVIQSQNYLDSDGIEGWKIDSDGSADFNDGTWRGSVANGLVFRPPTYCEINKNMTHAEAFKTLKKAGIGAGVYNGSGLRESQAQKSSIQNSLVNTYPRYSISGIPFMCTDYDSDALDCNIPFFFNNSYYKVEIEYFANKDTGEPCEQSDPEAVKKTLRMPYGMFGMVANVIPFTANSVIFAVWDYDESKPYKIYLKTWYLLKIEAIQKIIDLKYNDLPNLQHLVPGGNIRGTTWRRYDSFFDYMLNYAGAIELPELSKRILVQETDKPLFYAYPISTNGISAIFFDQQFPHKHGVGAIFAYTNSDGVDNRIVEFGFGNLEDDNNLSIAPIFPMSNIISKGDSVDVFCRKYSPSEQKIIKVIASVDFSQLPVENTIIPCEIKHVFKEDEDASICIIENDNRFFGWIIRRENISYEGMQNVVRFVEITETGYRSIPNEDYFWRLDYLVGAEYKLKNNAVISNLFLQDGVIYGSVCGCLFAYEILTDKYLDLTIDLLSVIKIESNLHGFLSNPCLDFVSGVDVLEAVNGQKISDVTSAISNICYDSQEQAVFLNYKIPLRLVDKSFDQAKPGDPAKNDLWINVPVYFYPTTQTFKVFTIPTTQSMLNTAVNTGFTLICHAGRRMFCNETGAILLNNYKIITTEYAIPNYTIREYKNAINAGTDVMSMLGYYTVYDMVVSHTTELYTVLMMICSSQYTNRYLDKGLDSYLIPIKKNHLTMNSLFPFFSRRIIVREFADRLDICYVGVIPGYQSEPSISTNHFIRFVGLDLYVKSDNIVPFLSIYKDKNEPLKVSFTWDFPAQLTCTEEIKEIFNSIMQSKNYHIE